LRSEDISAAFVGCLDLSDGNANNVAYSQPAILFQERMLEGLKQEGIEVSAAFSQRAVASFPAGEKLWYGAKRVAIRDRFPTVLLPFVNFGPVKTITGGMALFPLLLHWAWKHRRVRNRAILLYNVTSPPGIVSLLAGRLTGTKVIALVADIQVPGSGDYPGTILRRLEYLLATRTLDRFDGLITITSNIARDFAPHTPNITMEGAIPDDWIGEGGCRADSADDPGTEAGDIILMYAGYLTEMKGVPLLLDAFARLDGGNFRLWITGKGKLQSLVEDAAKRDPRITFWGFPPYERVLEMYRNASILINPHSTLLRSARYLFPSKLIEYLATGRPVISTCSDPGRNGEYRDLFFPLVDETPEGLAEQIRRVAAMPETERRSVGARGRDFVLERKTWKVQSSRIAGFIRQIAGTKFCADER